MSFSTHSSFSTHYRILGSMQLSGHQVQPAGSAASVYADARGLRILDLHVPSHQHLEQLRVQWSDCGDGGGVAGIRVIQSEETVQCLNDPLAHSQERVRILKAPNKRLESKIWERLEKKGPQVRDWGHYFKTIEHLSAQIFASSVDNAYIVLQIGSARIAAPDSRVKYETKLAKTSMWKVTSVGSKRSLMTLQLLIRQQLETEIEAFKEELLLRAMKKK